MASAKTKLEIKTTLSVRYEQGMKRIVQGHMRGVNREALTEIGEYWHERYLPLHFTTAAYSRYQYQVRSARYESHKAKRYGHTKPLVHSGRLESALLGTHEIRTTNNAVKVRMPVAPWVKGYLAFRGRYGTGPDKEKEILTVVPDEGKRFVTMYERRLKRAMKGA